MGTVHLAHVGARDHHGTSSRQARVGGWMEARVRGTGSTGLELQIEQRGRSQAHDASEAIEVRPASGTVLDTGVLHLVVIVDELILSDRESIGQQIRRGQTGLVDSNNLLGASPSHVVHHLTSRTGHASRIVVVEELTSGAFGTKLREVVVIWSAGGADMSPCRTVCDAW